MKVFAPQWVRLALAVSALVAAPYSVAEPLDLQRTWELARQADPHFQAERAAHQAGQTQAKQGRSLWLPKVGASATAGVGSHKSTMRGANFTMPGMGSDDVEFNTSIRNGDVFGYEVGLEQPLLNRQNLSHSRQLRLAADVAELKWQQAQQNLVLSSAEHYFNVLVARQAVAVLERQQEQVRAIYDEVQERFELGELPITSIHETKAQLRVLEAQLAQAKLALETAELAYEDFTGQYPAELVPLAITAEVEAPDIGDVAHWQEQARMNNLHLKMQASGIKVAQEDVAALKSWHSPTLSLVGRLAHEKIDGSGRYGDAMNKADEWMVGVQLSVPIFTGGYRSNKRKEASYLLTQRRAEGVSLAQQIQRQTHSAWRGIHVNYERLTALQDAYTANKERLKATQLGFELGDNTTLERLTAENALAETELNLLEAQVALIMNQLQLRALVGGGLALEPRGFPALGVLKNL